MVLVTSNRSTVPDFLTSEVIPSDFYQPTIYGLHGSHRSGSQGDILGRRPEPLERRPPSPAIRSPAGLEPAHVSAAASDDNGDPAVAIVFPGSPAHNRVVVRVKREEGYAGRVELVVARRVRVVRPLVRKGERRGAARGVDRDNLVKFAHRQPHAGVREERGEGLCEGRVGELSD